MNRLLHQQSGQSLMEYSLILVVIAVIAVIAIQALVSPIGEAVAEVGTTIESVSTDTGIADKPVVYELEDQFPAPAYSLPDNLFTLCNGDKFTITPKLKKCPN